MLLLILFQGFFLKDDQLLFIVYKSKTYIFNGEYCNYKQQLKAFILFPDKNYSLRYFCLPNVLFPCLNERFLFCLILSVCWAFYPVEQFSPALHGDTLEDSEDGEQDVVKLSDAIVRPQPVALARAVFRTRPRRRLYPTWNLFSDITWLKKINK